MKDIVELYGSAFTEIYAHDKERMSKILGIELTSPSSARKRMQQITRDIHLGHMDYFDKNDDLVAILAIEEDKPLQVVRAAQIEKEVPTFVLAVPRFEFKYIFIYTLNNGG